MATRIDRIEMSCFRGATNNSSIQLDPSKPITIIFGENGSGKSTIVDAVDFVLNEEYGSLNERSSTSPKTRYLPSIGSTAGKVEASVSAAGKTWTGRLASSGPKASGPTPKLKAVVLRRSQMFQFITETPNQRYKALQEFIALPAIQKSESSLRAAYKNKSGEYNEAVRAKGQADEALESLWNDEGRSGNSAWEWAKSQAAKDASELAKSVATLDAILRDLDAASNIRVRLQPTRIQFSNDTSTLEQAEQELRREEGIGDGDGGPLVSLLEEVHRYLEKREPPEVCPICESSQRAAGLLDSVAFRLAQMKRLASMKKKVDSARTSVQKSQAIFADAEKALTAAVRHIWRSHGGTLSKAIKIDTTRYEILREKGPVLIGIEAVAETESLWLEVEKVRERIVARRDGDQKTLNQLKAIQNYVSIVETRTKSATALQLQVKRLEALLAIVETQRKRYIDEVLNSVASLVETMYSRVHPDEGIGKARLYLKPNVQGSLEFEAQFQHASAVPPQAYYSDSHLDTLGICLFLALARYFNDDDGVIILDDVLTSADGDHLDRLIAMLQEEAEHFNQLIITTHHTPWLERYRRSESSHVDLIKLSPWSLAQGIRVAKA